MAQIPPAVLHEQISELSLLRRGKVRDTYELPGHPDLLLVLASDRISIFDFVLNAEVPEKGMILTAMNAFWRRRVLKDSFGHDLVACGAGIDTYLPDTLRGNIFLQSRATVVRRLEMLPVEAIVRGCLTGSGLSAYRDTRQVCGHALPDGLQDGDCLPYLLFTPTTKAEVGHDEHITADSVAERYGVAVERTALQVFALAQEHARKRGILLADTKFELGTLNGRLTVGDEVLTPDSSRFWDLREWQTMQAKPERKSPTAFDKQFVRQWGIGLGINKRKPEIAEDVAWVHAQSVPPEVLRRTTQIYRYIFWRLTGVKLESFQRDQMGIRSALGPVVSVEIISGSASDVAQMEHGLRRISGAVLDQRVKARRHVISCHRNPAELAQYAKDVPNDAVVIAGAGMAAALPGVLKALLVKEGKGHIPVLGVAFSGQDKSADQAARLSIEQLPGQPVLLQPDGTAYFGAEGFEKACKAAIEDEFLPVLPSAQKPAEIDLPVSGS